jgi:hypothetical protein
MTNKLISTLFGLNDENYKIALARQNDMDAYIEGFRSVILDNVDDIKNKNVQNTTVISLEHAKEYAHTARTMLYLLGRDVENIDGKIEDDKLKIASNNLNGRSLGYTFIIDKSFDYGNLNAVKAFYKNDKKKRDIWKMVYLSASPVKYEIVESDDLRLNL